MFSPVSVDCTCLIGLQKINSLPFRKLELIQLWMSTEPKQGDISVLLPLCPSTVFNLLVDLGCASLREQGAKLRSLKLWNFFVSNVEDLQNMWNSCHFMSMSKSNVSNSCQIKQRHRTCQIKCQTVSQWYVGIQALRRFSNVVERRISIISKTMPEHIFEYMSNNTSEHVRDRMSEYIPELMSGTNYVEPFVRTYGMKRLNIWQTEYQITYGRILQNIFEITWNVNCMSNYFVRTFVREMVQKTSVPLSECQKTGPCA